MEQNDFGRSSARIVERYRQRRPINHIEARFFCEIVRGRPWILDRVRELALRAARSGKAKYSARAIVEVLRWGYLREPRMNLELNDHMIPYVARYVQETTPDLPANFFILKPVHETRRDNAKLAEWMAVLRLLDEEDLSDAA